MASEINKATVAEQLMEALLANGLMDALEDGSVDEELINELLNTPQLEDADLMALAGMGMEELFSRMLIDGAALEGAEAPEASEMLAETDAWEEPLQEQPRERIAIFIDALAVEAKIMLNQPSANEASPSETEMYQALAARGIISGIKEAFVERLAAYPVYNRRFKIAEGVMPVNGEDGQAIFHFDTSVALTPSVSDGDIVDYKELDFAKNVKKGEVLCELIPPTQGQVGRSILGGTLPGNDGRPTAVRCGGNTRLTEDGRAIIAECDGQVYLKDNKVCVSRVMTVDNVDISTGNIFFVGTIYVRGDVRGGFSVVAGGDIVVKGAVENARLVAGNHIVLANGINGKDGGYLKAGGDVRANFIENATIEAKGNVSADVLLNACVHSESSILAVGRRGYIMGGEYTAREHIFAYDIGSTAFVATKVALAAFDGMAGVQAQQLAQIAKYQEGIGKMEQITEAAASADWDQKTKQRMMLRAAYLKQQMQQAVEQMSVQEKEDEDKAARVKGIITAREHLYPGVTIEIGGASTVNEVLRNGCDLKNKAGLIVASK